MDRFPDVVTYDDHDDMTNLTRLGVDTASPQRVVVIGGRWVNGQLVQMVDAIEQAVLRTDVSSSNNAATPIVLPQNRAARRAAKARRRKG